MAENSHFLYIYLYFIQNYMGRHIPPPPAMNRYDDLPEQEQAQIDLAIADYFEANNYSNFLAASETLNMSVPAVWNKILQEAGLPECEMPTLMEIK